MYRTIQDFLTDWKYERDATLKVHSILTDEISRQVVHAEVRSLERLAWHLTQTITEMGHKAGLFDVDALEHKPIPQNITSLYEFYKNYSEHLIKAVHSKWTDSSLLDMVDMYGEQWRKGTILRVLIAHQSHHRGQMTVLMRIFGLPVPGIYGPSKEEWAEMGMAAPE